VASRDRRGDDPGAGARREPGKLRVAGRPDEEHRQPERICLSRERVDDTGAVAPGWDHYDDARPFAAHRDGVPGHGEGDVRDEPTGRADGVRPGVRDRKGARRGRAVEQHE